MKKVKLTITEASCRGGHFFVGQTFIVDELCPPICHELWNIAYPYVFALQNGAELDADDRRARAFDVCCPDGCRVKIHGELVEEK